MLLFLLSFVFLLFGYLAKLSTFLVFETNVFVRH